MSECKDHGACPSVAMGLEEIKLAQAKISSEWQLDTAEPNKISRELKFKNFAEALNFTNEVGEIAEGMNHHPDITLKWGYVRVDYWTHNAGGLSQMDFDAALKVDQLV